MKQGGKQQFSARDIERYYAGSMSPEERHAIEEAALEDPFLADAMEGYPLTRSPLQDISQLRKRLENRVAPERQRGIVAMMPGWIKVAAVVLIVVGGGWLIMMTILPRSRQIAKTNNDTMGNTVSNTRDSAAQKPMKEEGRFGKQISDSNTVRNNEVARTDQSKNYQLKKAPTQKQANSPVLKDNDDAVAEKKVEDTGFSKTISSSRALVAAPAIATRSYAAQEVRSGNAAKSEVEKNDKPALAKEKSTGQKEVAVSRKMGQSFHRIVLDSVQALRPAGGWEKFDEYISTNIKSATDLGIEAISGNIILYFEVNNSGSAVNIKVNKPLCDQCDQEAVRLLQNGPKWQGAGRQGKLTIRF